MIVLERDGIVVNNADGEGLSRLQVFIYGIHDITGNKILFEYIPWAYSSQSVVSVPPIWTPVKVKTKIHFGQNPIYAFMDGEKLEWHSPSPYIKLTGNRDPRIFILYDNDRQEWLDETPPDYTSINKKISQLKEQKKVKEQNLEENRKQLSLLTSDSQDIKTLENENLQIEEEYDAIIQEKQQLDSNYQINKRTLEERLLSEQKFSEITFSNRDDESMDELEYYLSVSQNTRDRINELENSYELQRASIGEREQSNATRLGQNKDARANLVNYTENQEILKNEINKLTEEIKVIDNDLTNLENNSSSGAKAATSFGELQRLDARVGRFDKDTNKVYNTDGELIGNWTGQKFYVPGYALQPGTPIPKRKLNRLIKPESYLTYNNTNGSSTNQPSTIITPSDSQAIKKSDDSKTHSCDISDEIRVKILTKRQSVMMAVKWLRDKISALISFESGSAIGQWVKASVNQLTALLKSVQRFLKFINDVILEIAALIAKIRQLINWILSLPARLLILLQECLTHFFNTIGEAFTAELSIGGIQGESSSFTEIVSLVNQAQSTFQTATETVSATAIVYTEIKAVESTFEKV
jgi:ABC-type molybdate transport system permease subunit